MQENNHDDDLNNLPSFSLSDDELSSRSGEQEKKREHFAAGPSDKTPAAQRNIKKSGSSNKRSIFLLIVIIIIITGSAWQFNEFNQKLQQSQAKINQLVAQMDQISGSITSNGKAATQTTEQLNRQFKALSQSQQNMAKTLAEVQTTIDGHKKDIANLRWRNKLDSTAQAKDTKQLTTLNKQQEVQDKQIAGLTSQIKNINANQLSSTAAWQSQFDQLKEKTEALSQAAKQDNSAAAIDKKLAGYDSAIKSMDNYRLQINRRLLQLENSVRTIQQNSR